MKNNVKSTALILTGMVISASLSPVASAAAEYFQAQRTAHLIYVDGRQAQLEAYAINGNNYVKLRDIGEAVGFEVYWDGSAAQVFSDKPYTGQTPQAKDHGQTANPAIIRNGVKREVYNTIREAVVTGETVSFGSAVKGLIGLQYGRDEALFPQAEQELQQIKDVLAAIGQYPDYRLESANGEYVCRVTYPDTYIPVEEHTRNFIASLAGLSDREKVKRIVWYVDDRIAYDATCYAWPYKALVQDGIARGACMSYAYGVQYLCQQAGIPCILISGGNHQWNMVYAEGRWWDVDATANDRDGVDLQTYGSGGAEWEEYIDFDGTDAFRERFYVTADRVLWDRTTMEHFNDNYTDGHPEATEFAKELLVPGSSR